jgi:putative ABC transport system permease protein
VLTRAALRNLLRNVRRTLAVLLTVAVGTASLFLFHGFNAGIMNQYRDNTIRARYGHRAFDKPWEHWIAYGPGLRDEIARAPGVREVFPRVTFAGILTNGRVDVSGVGQGIDGEAEARFFTTLNVVDGAPLGAEPDGIVLGQGLARALDVRPGDRVTVLASTLRGTMNGVDLTVTGVFHTGAKEFDDSVFRVPLAQAQALLDTDRVETIALGLRALDDWDAAASAIVAAHPDLEATSFAKLDEVYYQHSVDWLKAQFGVIQIIILTIVLLGIFNTISTAVLERKQEIGDLRANGESSLDVLALLALEGALLGVLGALLGLALGLAVVHGVIPHGIVMPAAPGITRQFAVRIELQPSMALATFAMGTCAALVATVLAALRVARLPIGEALRAT